MGGDVESWPGRLHLHRYRGTPPSDQQLDRTWGEYDVEVVRYADASDDVVVLFRERGHGGVSGAAVERQLGEVWTLRDGKVVRVRLYGRWDEALEAAGLRESDLIALTS
jgi:ketosteroid isomerase-like protein